DGARLARWLEVEELAVEAWAKLGVVPVEHADAVRSGADKLLDEKGELRADVVTAVAEREAVTDHDVAAFVDVVQDAIGQPAGGWVHYGLTSSDVVDTAQCTTLVRAADLLVAASGSLVAALKAKAIEHRATPMVGRTHGIHAEPTTFGAKLALWCLQADRDRQRLRSARRAVAVGKLSGAVGTYSNIDPAVEAHVCAALGLTPTPATQVVARDRHAEYLWACASVGASVEAFATEIRHLQRTEVGEAEEPFATGRQKGSSAMPHKRNPIKTEQLSGLARVLRGYLGAGLEDVALWHERDISHSSVERIVLPDASLLAFHVMRRMTAVIEGLVVHPERMISNLEASHGLVFSQPVLLALVASGLERDAAYRVVQRNAMAAWEERRPFRSLLEADPDVNLNEAQLDEAFSLERALRHTDRVFDALEEVDAG
ncbi:MAG TPA: adenylosuccinate lyase, partial [Acidimicrobiales bacterium]|nr:adenylosuccinate lyase [Acidimicrobiales bacterium]